MSIIDLIKSLTLNVSPSFDKSSGDNATNSKIKAKNIQGDTAGRDIHKTYVSEAKKEVELPYVSLMAGAFGGNGHDLRMLTCEVHNLSEQHVFIEKINILGEDINFSDALIKPNDSLRYGEISGLRYPESDDQYAKIIFHTKDRRQFEASQKLLLKPRAVGNFDVNGFESPNVKYLASE